MERKQTIVKPAKTDMVYAAKAFARVKNVCIFILSFYVRPELSFWLWYNFLSKISAFFGLYHFSGIWTQLTIVTKQVSKQRHLKQGFLHRSLSRYLKVS